MFWHLLSFVFSTVYIQNKSAVHFNLLNKVTKNIIYNLTSSFWGVISRKLQHNGRPWYKHKLQLPKILKSEIIEGVAIFEYFEKKNLYNHSVNKALQHKHNIRSSFLHRNQNYHFIFNLATFPPIIIYIILVKGETTVK